MFSDDIKFLQKAIILHPDRDKKFLALKRSADSFSRPNDWDLPGGNVLFADLHEDSLRKEIREEAGLEVGDFTPVQVITSYDAIENIYRIFNGFVCRATTAEITLSEEHVEYRWLTKEEFVGLKPATFLVDLIAVRFEKEYEKL